MRELGIDKHDYPELPIGVVAEIWDLISSQLGKVAEEETLTSTRPDQESKFESHNVMTGFASPRGLSNEFLHFVSNRSNLYRLGHATAKPRISL